MMGVPKATRGEKIIKVLLKHGFKIKSRKGSHVSLSNGKIHVTVVLPITTIGVLLKICRITNIPKEEFL